MLRSSLRASRRIKLSHPLRALSAQNEKHQATTKVSSPVEDPVPVNYNGRMLKLLSKHLWPDSSVSNHKEIKARVVTSMSFMVGAKLVTIQVPFLFRDLIDNFGEKINNGEILPGGVELTENTVNALNTMSTEPLLAAPIALVIGYGLARTTASASQELRSAVFSNVAQQAIRRVSGDVFEHLMARDLQFHLDRKIGALSRVIDRGGRSIQFALSSMLFSVVPTALEIGNIYVIL